MRRATVPVLVLALLGAGRLPAQNVTTIGGHHYAETQFHLEPAHPGICEIPHYHAAAGNTVTDVNGQNPLMDPGGCGFGSLSFSPLGGSGSNVSHPNPALENEPIDSFLAAFFSLGTPPPVVPEPARTRTRTRTPAPAPADPPERDPNHPPPGLSAADECKWIFAHEVGDILRALYPKLKALWKANDESITGFVPGELYDVYNVSGTMDSYYLQHNVWNVYEITVDGQTHRLIGGELNYAIQGLFWRMVGVSKWEMHRIINFYHSWVKPKSSGGGKDANVRQHAAADFGFDAMDAAMNSGDRWSSYMRGSSFQPDIKLISTNTSAPPGW